MNGNSRSIWVKIKANIVALTGVLLAIPALINAGIDIYNVALKIPRTTEERINAELFKTYFNKPPIVTVPVPVKTSMGSIEMRLSIYDAGDVLAEYGDHSKWFPSPMKQQMAGDGWFAQALAEPFGDPKKEKLKGIGKYTQKDIATDGNKILRARYFENGVKETFTIDMNSGRIDDKKIEQINPLELKLNNSADIQVMDFKQIDLEALKKTPNTPH
jgi:hypothetical protein